jgi:hypothetical protein
MKESTSKSLKYEKPKLVDLKEEWESGSGQQPRECGQGSAPILPDGDEL